MISLGICSLSTAIYTCTNVSKYLENYLLSWYLILFLDVFFFLQIKKCLQDNCSYCVLNPVRMPEEIFRELSFLPDPVSSPSGGFKAFTEVFGTDTNDSDRPGLKENPTASDRDKKFKALLVGSKFCKYK